MNNNIYSQQALEDFKLALKEFRATPDEESTLEENHEELAQYVKALKTVENQQKPQLYKINFFVSWETRRKINNKLARLKKRYNCKSNEEVLLMIFKALEI